MDSKTVSIIGLGILAYAFKNKKLMNQSESMMRDDASGVTIQNANELEYDSNSSVYNTPASRLADFQSNRYDISFKYPKDWVRNPRYEDKYEGTTGFFEVADFESSEDNIDEAVKQQVNESYRPYGSKPRVVKLTVDGQPARVIYPSSDQAEYIQDRDAALVVQYPAPIEINGLYYPFVVIWATKDYLPLIIRTFKFTS